MPAALGPADLVAQVAPTVMGIGPVAATAAGLQRADLKLSDLDIIELNEAFTAQVLACTREWGFGDAGLARLNLHGSGISPGHQVGTTGTRILTTMARKCCVTTPGTAWRRGASAADRVGRGVRAGGRVIRAFGSVDEVKPAIGEQLGLSDPLMVNQDRITGFAETTADLQWIHVDLRRAAAGLALRAVATFVDVEDGLDWITLTTRYVVSADEAAKPACAAEIGTGSGSLGMTGVATVFFNETVTTPAGQLQHNAIRIHTLLGQDIIVAGCRLA